MRFILFIAKGNLDSLNWGRVQLEFVFMKLTTDDFRSKNQKNGQIKPPQRKFRRGLILAGVTLIISLLLLFYWMSCTVQASSPADIRAFLESYFSTWSARDLKAYRSHFHEDARIFYISSKPYTIDSLDLNSFMTQQSFAHVSSSEPMYEKMTNFTANADPKAASVSVQWELHKGSVVITGTDRFILYREPTGNWKIMALLFYE